jgi:hypothetical protein
LQMRLSAESIESMLGDGHFEISARSESLGLGLKFNPKPNMDSNVPAIMQGFCLQPS